MARVSMKNKTSCGAYDYYWGRGEGEDAGTTTDVGGAVRVFGGPPTQDFKELRVSASSRGNLSLTA